MPMLTEREVRLIVGEDIHSAGFPKPIQHGPEGRKWNQSAIDGWVTLKGRSRKARKTQTRPTPGGETRPAE